MRILQVRFKNLNSLVGEWQIDLTHPAFESDGIFAITGPTGAGKTTILDAVCLALYGRTPRLNRVSRSENEIMSRQTGECYAEVTFETQSGRYRCHWSQFRARGEPDGELKAPKHEIADADSGEVFESRIKGVAEQIELATGMDFDRFTRSMLLAQGGFAAFLQAAPNDRAPILEQITGTEIYSRISIRVHEQLREEKEKLNLLKAEREGIVVLTPERVQEIEQLLETKQKEESSLAADIAKTREAVAWLTNIDELEKEISSLAEESDRLQIEMEAFRPDREKLGRALNAASLEAPFATLNAFREQQADDTTALTTEEEALPELGSSAEEQARVLEYAEQQTALSKEELKAARSIWQRVRSLDQKLAELEKDVLKRDESCKGEASRIDSHRRSRLEEQEKRSRVQEALELADGYLKDHAKDEWLISGLAGVEEKLAGLLSKQEEISQKESEREAATVALALAKESLDARERQYAVRKQELEDASKQLQDGKDALSLLLGDRLLREYRAEKENLLREMAFLAKIMELEEHRTKLEDGKPCPLCGATEHPFAEGNVPVPDDAEKKIGDLTELITKAEDQEAAIRKLEDSEALARQYLAEAESLESEATSEKKAAEKALAEVEDDRAKLQADLTRRRKAVLTGLRPLGIMEISENEISSLIESLKARSLTWQTKVEEKADLEKQTANIDSEIKQLDAVIQTLNNALSESRDHLADLKKELARGTEERFALYGDKNPDEEEGRLNKVLSDAEDAERQARDEHNKLQQKLINARAGIASLKKRIDQREPELRRLEAEFSEALARVGFSDEEQFRTACLPAETREKLAAKADGLDERQTDLRARQKDREVRLATVRARKVTDESLKELEPRLKEQEEDQKEMRDTIAGLKYQLKDNVVAKKRIQENQIAIEAREKEYQRWENLHKLIGSADGKKYRNFAQGLTFGMMVAYANRQLQKMNDRYLLVRDETRPLELNVIDNYQAGEVRSTKNLSGGESFIVSLSLALGLSQMASKNVRVDSLFLDEGFGTLDEEYLDTALETLAGLQHDGKVIGIISHVTAISERVRTQIQVIPQTGGRSRISGPGCSRPSGPQQNTTA